MSPVQTLSPTTIPVISITTNNMACQCASSRRSYEEGFPVVIMYGLQMWYLISQAHDRSFWPNAVLRSGVVNFSRLNLALYRKPELIFLTGLIKLTISTPCEVLRQRTPLPFGLSAYHAVWRVRIMSVVALRSWRRKYLQCLLSSRRCPQSF